MFLKMLWFFRICVFAKIVSPHEGRSGQDGNADVQSQNHRGVLEGWDWQPSKAMRAKYGTRHGATETFCDLPIFDSAKIPKEVQNDPAWRFKPFVIRKGLTLMKDGFAKAHLLQNAKKDGLIVKYGYSWTIVRQDGYAKEEVPFEKFVTDYMHTKKFDGKEQMERPSVFHSYSPLLGVSGTQFGIPPLIHSWEAESKLRFSKHSATPNLMIGAALSGVGFHSHSAALQMSAHGYKRWLLYPPDRSPPGGAIAGDWPIFDWLDKLYPTLKGDAKPLECIQEPGDLIWIPESWYHATLNLGDTVAVSILNHKFESEEFRLQQTITLERGAERLDRLRNLAKLQPYNADAKVTLAIELALDGKVAEAEKLLNDVLKADPSHTSAMVTVAEILENKLEAKLAGAKKKLKKRLETFVPSLQLNPRCFATTRLLSRYYELIGDQAKLAQYDRRLDFLEQAGIDEASLFESTGKSEAEQDL